MLAAVVACSRVALAAQGDDRAWRVAVSTPAIHVTAATCSCEEEGQEKTLFDQVHTFTPLLRPAHGHDR